MPNHVTNIITAPPEVLAALAGEAPVDFNTLVPMPKGLRDFSPNESEVRKAKGEYVREQEESWIKSENVEHCKANLRKCGHAYWYSWASENWGTKWNAYDIVAAEPGKVQFDTAWSCPLPILEALAARFPEAEITLEYADEDIGHNCGTLVFRGGALATSTRPHGREARMFAYRVKGFSPERIAEYESECDKA